MNERTVGQIAAELPVSIRVFEAWKIDYCCGGRQSLADACATAGKTVDEFAAALESAVVPPQFPVDLSLKSLSEMSSQIVQTYHQITRAELATLAPLAAKVLGVHGARRPELAAVVSLIQELTADMLPHMLKEEQILFPYVVQLENAAIPPTPFFGTVKNPVRMMMLEHERVGELLVALRLKTDEYSVPADACFSYRELYRRLAEFELLTHEHIHIENNMYFPRAIEMEERAGAAADFAFAHACGTSSCA